jgi:WD40 repeat protein
MNPTDSPSSPSGNTDSPVAGESPWPGLESYTESSRQLFFGREKETEELVRLIRRNTLTVLFGQSGLGKSSLLQAGAFPVLRAADFLPLYLRLDHSPEGPPLVDQVRRALTASFSATRAEAPEFCASETLWEYFHRKDVDIWSAKNRLLTPVLAFDQFEEIFTLGRASEAQRARGRAFLTELADLVENRAPAGLREKFDSGELDIARYNFDKPSCQVVLSLREDFLPDLEGLKHEMRSILHSRMRVRRLDGTQALAIVQKPAPDLVAEGAAERIVEFVAGARGGSAERLLELEVEPALLSVICRELNERRRARGQVQITADLVSGNRREILTDFYERCVGDLPEAMRTFVEDRLLTKSGFRDNLALETALEEPGVNRALIDTLVARRLLRIEDRLGVQRVELTHDVLAEVIRASRDARQQRLVLLESSRRARRQRWVIGGLSAAVFALCVGAVFGIRAQRRAEQAQRDEAARSSRTDLAYGSQLLEQGQVSEGIAHLGRAVRSDPLNYAAGPRLISALAYRAFALPVGLTYPHDHGVYVGGFTSDGSRVVTTTDQRKIFFWDVATGRQVSAPATLDSEPQASAVSADGTRCAVALTDGTLRVWDLATGKQVAGPLPNGRSTIAVALTPDGRWLAAGNSEASVKLWDASTGELKATLPHAHWVSSVEFSADGRHLISTDFGRDAATRHWRVWAVPSGEPLTPRLSGASSQINLGRFSPDGKLAVICDNGGAQLWDWAAARKVGQKMPGVSRGPVHFSPDGTWLLSVGRSDRTARIWDAPAGTLRRKFDFAGEAVLSRDGRRLLGAWPDGSVHLVDTSTGQPLIEPLRSGSFLQARFSVDEREIWTGGRDGVVRRWRATATAAAPLKLSANRSLGGFFVTQPQTLILGQFGIWEYRDLVTGKLLGPTLKLPDRVRSLRPSDDLKVTLAVTQGGDLELWDLRQPDAIKRHRLPRVATPRTGFSDSGNRLFVYEFGSAVSVWDTDTGRLIGQPLPTPNGRTSNTTLSADGTKLAAGDTDGNVIVYEVATGQKLGEIVHHGSQVTGLAFSPDGSRLVSGAVGRTVQLTEVATGRAVLPAIKLGAPPNVFGFSSDGRQITIPTQSNNAVVFWDTQTGAQRVLQLSNEKSVASFDFDRDNHRIAISDTLDSRIRIWSTATGQPVVEPIAPENNRSYVVFSPDGRFILTYGTSPRTALVWPVPPLVTTAPLPAWLGRLAAAVAGGAIGATGEFRAASVAPAEFDTLRAELAALPDDAPFVSWGRWFLADPERRAISPEVALTAAEAAELAKEDSLELLVGRSRRLRRLDNRVEAEVVERQIVELARTHQTPESATISSALQVVVTDLIKSERFSDAEPLARACLELRERVWPKNSSDLWVISNSRGSIGEALAGQKRYAEAEPFLLRAHDELKDTKGAAADRAAEIGRVLARLYEATQQPAKAAEWRERVAGAAEPGTVSTSEPVVP